MTNITISSALRWLAVSAITVAMLTSCSGHGDQHEDEHKEEAHEGEIAMSAEAVKESGIKVEAVSSGEFHNVVKTSGVIENPAGRQAVVSAPSTGIVSFTRELAPGMAVSAGQSLFTIASKGTEQGDNLRPLQVAKETAARDLKRAEELLAERLITRREYEQAKGGYESACAALTSVGAAAHNGKGVAAPMSGHIVALNVVAGAFVNMGDPLATIAQSSRLVVRADVSERDYASLASLGGANLVVPGVDEPLRLADHGFKLLSVSPTVAAGSHYLPVYIEFDNPGNLTNGTVVEVYLLSEPRQGVISIQRQALTEEEGSFYVYRMVHPNVFKKTLVAPGGADGERVEIIEGLKAGDQIAVEGALRVKMAGMGSAIPAHSHNH